MLLRPAVHGCLVLTLVLTGCTVTINEGSSASAPGTEASSAPAGGAPGTGDGLAALPATCRMRGPGLPDPACTPGAADPAVTQANIHSTICLTGYTKQVRPPVSYTEPLKRELFTRYGDTGSLADYELDHLIPLEIGGAPRSVQNLWPEPHAGAQGSVVKDRFELYLHDQVCGGRMALADAQHAIASNWVQAWQQAGSP